MRNVRNARKQTQLKQSSLISQVERVEQGCTIIYGGRHVNLPRVGLAGGNFPLGRRKGRPEKKGTSLREDWRTKGRREGRAARTHRSHILFRTRSLSLSAHSPFSLAALPPSSSSSAADDHICVDSTVQSVYIYFEPCHGIAFSKSRYLFFPLELLQPRHTFILLDYYSLFEPFLTRH